MSNLEHRHVEEGGVPQESLIARTLLDTPVAGDRRGFLKFLGGLATTAAAAAACSGTKEDTVGDAQGAIGSGDAPPAKHQNQVCDTQPEAIDTFRNAPLHDCAGCHSPGKVGDGGWVHDDGTHGPQPLQKAFDSILPKVSKTTSDGKPWMVEFAEGRVKNDAGFVHAGGKQQLTQEQVDSLTKLHNLTSQVQPGATPPSFTVNTACEDQAYGLDEATFFKGVNMHSPAELHARFLRSVTGGPLPLHAPQFKDQDALRDALRHATGYIGFYRWLVTKSMDFTQTKFYDEGDEAIKFLGDTFGVNWAAFNNKELARGPGNLLAYIVANERSIQEFITADYVVLPGQKHPNDKNPDEHWVTRLAPVKVKGAPVSGIATDPLWLGRVGTSETNIGRHRAWEILRRFFNFDVLDIGSRNVEAPKNVSLPTLTYPACVACHGAGLDDAAAAFTDYQKMNEEHEYHHKSKLPAPFLAISLNGHKIPSDHTDRLGQFMDIIAADERPDIPFAKSMAKMAFTMLMDRDPVKPPRLGAEDYEPKMRRFKVEDTFLTEMAHFLKAHNYNFRELIVEMAMSRWFAANGQISEPLSPGRQVELEFVGPGMITPEVFGMRLRQLFGNDVHDLGIMKLILNEYNLDLGGIDGKTVTVRNPDPHAANELVRIFVGFESDKLVQNEFAKPPDARYLFTHLNWGSSPVEAPFHPLTNQPIPGNEEKYRAQLVKIHALAFGKYYAPDSPEITAAYKQWTNIWMKMLENLGNSKIANSHVPKGVKDSSDPQGLLRAWGAYMSSIISGMDFNV